MEETYFFNDVQWQTFFFFRRKLTFSSCTKLQWYGMWPSIWNLAWELLNFHFQSDSVLADADSANQYVKRYWKVKGRLNKVIPASSVLAMFSRVWKSYFFGLQPPDSFSPPPHQHDNGGGGFQHHQDSESAPGFGPNFKEIIQEAEPHLEHRVQHVWTAPATFRASTAEFSLLAFFHNRSRMNWGGGAKQYTTQWTGIVYFI